MNKPAPSPAETFISRFGRTVVFFSGVGVLIGLVHNLLAYTAVPKVDSPLMTEPFVLDFKTTFRIMAAIILIGSTLSLWTSLAFLKRRDWARKTMHAVFLVAATFYAAGTSVALYFVAFPPAQRPLGELSVDPPTRFRVLIASAAYAGLAWLLWRIAKRLRSADVRAEFTASDAD